LLTLSAFASLAQFGAGLALALAFFLEPIIIRSNRFRSKLDEAFSLIPNDLSISSQEKRSEVWQNVIRLNRQTKSAIRLSRIPVTFIQTGAAINFLVLIASTMKPNFPVPSWYSYTLLAALILPIGIGAIWLLLLAKLCINDVD
jgi:hypothetical protein